MWQRGLDALGALQLYALLTVGDGLVSQVPALLISTATGVFGDQGGVRGQPGDRCHQSDLALPADLTDYRGGTCAVWFGRGCRPFLSLSLRYCFGG